MAVLMTVHIHKPFGPVQLRGLTLAESAAFLPPGAFTVISMHTW